MYLIFYGKKYTLYFTGSGIIIIIIIIPIKQLKCDSNVIKNN